MKLPQILLGLIVWLASIGAAYYIGLQVTVDEESPRPMASDQKVDILPDIQPVDLTASDATLEVVSSFLTQSELNLDEALSGVGGLTEKETRALLAEAFALPENDYRRARMIRQLLRQLAETAPRDALAMAAEIESLRDVQQARRLILEVWGKNDPISALSWARVELANEPLRTQNRKMLAIFEGYAESNPKAAFAAALQLPSESNGQRSLQIRALEEIIQKQIKDGGLLEAKLQVELLEDGETKNALLRELVDEWASFDPVSAAAYVDSLGEDIPSSIKTALLSEWAENDPAAAADWLDSREVGEETLSRASRAIIREWTSYDMAASAEWLNSQPSSPTLDRAVMSYAYRAAQEDPASAMSWAESIDNNWMRNRMMQHVAGNWKTDDPDAFKAYLDNSGLNEEERKKLEDAEVIHGGRRWGL